MSQSQQPALVRAIGRWSLAALVVNSIIGSGIFGLPKDVARMLGHAAPLAYLLAAAGIGAIMACFAEVGSQFPDAGGPYLYARVTFGRFIGIQMGWLAWLVRLTSGAANANLFVIYLGEFWRRATSPAPRAALLTLLIAVLAAVNVRGVKAGTQVSNFFTVAKLLPLGVFILAGLFFLGRRVVIEPAILLAGASLGNWMQAVLALVFAYGGFEAALMPMGEVKDPRRDTPFALFTALGTCALFYTLIHIVVMGTLADPGASDRPLADAARQFLGAAGAALVALGALVSTYGYLSGQMLSVPRLTYALAEKKDFPPPFAAVHSRFRTPHVSIAVHALLAWLLAVYGSFLWNAILSAVARLFTYAIVCAALPVLRRRHPEREAFRLPAGWVFVLLGIAFCAVLVIQMGRKELAIIAATAALAFATWVWARGTSPET